LNAASSSGWVSRRFNPRRVWLQWTLPVALLLGGGGIEIPFRSELRDHVASEAGRYAICLEHLQGQGVVSSPLLGIVPLKRVWTDRVPQGENWNRVQFALISNALPNWEMPEEKSRALLSRLARDSEWVRWNEECSTTPAVGGSSFVTLWVKKSAIP
jgi:hypothetical protein